MYVSCFHWSPQRACRWKHTTAVRDAGDVPINCVKIFVKKPKFLSRLRRMGAGSGSKSACGLKTRLRNCEAGTAASVSKRRAVDQKNWQYLASVFFLVPCFVYSPQPAAKPRTRTPEGSLATGGAGEPFVVPVATS